jgi:hypothetical protein
MFGGLPGGQDKDASQDEAIKRRMEKKKPADAKSPGVQLDKGKTKTFIDSFKSSLGD